MTDETVQLVAKSLEPLREPLQADGADLELVDVDQGVARVRLVIGDESCSECIAPTSILQSILLASLSAKVPSISKVYVEDPRGEVGR